MISGVARYCAAISHRIGDSQLWTSTIGIGVNDLKNKVRICRF